MARPHAARSQARRLPLVSRRRVDFAAGEAAGPDLAGKLAAARRLTADSTAEQASAGLDALTDAELKGMHQGVLVDEALLGRLDAMSARAGLSQRLQASPPRLNDQGRVVLTQARHPFLVVSKDQVVPNDLAFDETLRVLIISGPNTVRSPCCTSATPACRASR